MPTSSPIDRNYQVRSYVVELQRFAKDLRTGVVVQDIDAVLDGDIDVFLRAAIIDGWNRERPSGAIPD